MMVTTYPRTSAGDSAGSLAVVGVASVALAGMAYVHIRDIGMKIDEHIYYMVGLFLVDISLSLALVPALIFVELRGSTKSRQIMWAATGALAAATIAGFIWSRTIGFPQMADHVGEWYALGISSLVFEGILVALSLVMLRHLARTTMHRQ
jgi:hypothetical protein